MEKDEMKMNGFKSLFVRAITFTLNAFFIEVCVEREIPYMIQVFALIGFRHVVNGFTVSKLCLRNNLPPS